MTQKILKQFASADIVECDRYGEIFNRKAQDFRLQKQRPSLVLARKFTNHVLSVPSGYGVGGTHNYYFSVMLNCIYDCRYCFLQGMYRSAHHVVFVNYDDFAQSIKSTVAEHDSNDQVWFFSGYDCDSLAMEPIIGMAQYFIGTVSALENVWLELRTKSTQIRSLLTREVVPNVVTAFSLTPQRISSSLEHKVPQLDKRIAAMERLQERGWKIGLRFDPLIFVPDYRSQYLELMERIFSAVDADLIHSVTIGAFRLPKEFYRTVGNLYPDSRFVAQPFELRNGAVTYPKSVEMDMKWWCYEQLGRFMDLDTVHIDELVLDPQ
ncbi:MAG: hypothetical protein OXI60_03725 [Acidiferrobacterales bacterium]|nr:hypothetical protein [Acidiferrobacterales bacterium]